MVRQDDKPFILMLWQQHPCVAAPILDDGLHHYLEDDLSREVTRLETASYDMICERAKSSALLHQ